MGDRGEQQEWSTRWAIGIEFQDARDRNWSTRWAIEVSNRNGAPDGRWEWRARWATGMEHQMDDRNGAPDGR